MKKFKVCFFKKYNNYLIKHNLSKRVASKIITKATSLLLCVIMTFSMIIPMWNYIQFSSKAEELFFGQNTLDGSTGVGVDSWKNANDLRYILYPLGFVLGDEATPYIIKNANELYSFSQSMTDSNVNAANKWIDIQGLTQADIDILNTTNINKYLTTNVIDLRMFGGASLSATAAIYWNPIGTATNPFKGNIFSSTGVSIINLNYSVDMRKTNTTTTEYGLFGHFAGTVGLKGSPINLSAMKIATSDEVIKQTSKELDFSANSDILTSIGGFAAINTGTIKNVNFGVGKYYDITDSINPIKDNYNYDNSIIIPNSTNSSINVGGIVGKNSGIVENCNFDGKIISNGERIKYTVLNGNVTGFTKESNLPIKDDSNVGGIAGFSENKILNSVSNAKIDIFNVQKKVKLGGIVGNATVNTVSLNGEVLKCVFLGSINAKTPKTSNITGSDISSVAGGIVGFSSNFKITHCASAGDITFSNIITDTGIVGGIVAYATQTTIVSECFAFGDVSGGTYLGGLIGSRNNTSELNNSYFTGTVKVLDVDGEKVGFFNSDYSNAYFDFKVEAGGLEGHSDSILKKGLENCYFAGSTLSPEMGSVFGSRITTGTTNVYFDKQLSPNIALASDSTAVSYAKNTNDFLSSSSNVVLSDKFEKSTDKYPQLKWIMNLTNDNELDKLIKNLSEISTKIYTDIKNENSIVNNGNLNIYQLKNTSLAINSVLKSFTNINYTQSNWNKIVDFSGNQLSSESIGGIFSTNFNLNYNKTNCTINLTRKLLVATNQTGISNANDIEDSTTFYRMLDIVNCGGGGYIGSKFNIIANITDNILINATTNQTIEDKKYINNIFCGEINGNNNTVNSLIMQEGFSSLFNYTLRSNIHNINFSNINVGNDTQTIKLKNKYSSVLTTYSAISKFENLNFDNIIVNASVDDIAYMFSIITNISVGSSDISSEFNNLKFNNAKIKILETKENFSYGAIAVIMKGNSNSTNIEVQNYNINLGNFDINNEYKNQGNNKFYYCSGLFGYISSKGQLKNININNINAKAYGYESNVTNGGFGSIASFIDNKLSLDINNIRASGSVNGFIGSTGNYNLRLISAGLFAVSKLGFSDCSFTGEVNSGVAGGLVGYADGSIKIYNSYSIANINFDPNKKNIKSDYSGGIIGNTGNAGNDIFNCFFTGNVTGIYAGGLYGKSNNAGKFSVENSYTKAIINSTTSSGVAGGLIGESAGNLYIKNSYFTGQLQGAGSKGGIAGSAPNNITNIISTYYDVSIAGKDIPAVSSISSKDPALGSTLTGRTAKSTDDITNNLLNSADSSVFVSSTTVNYPQLKNFSTSVNEKVQLHSNISTQKVFKVTSDDAYIRSIPDFNLLSAPQYTVSRDETETNGWSKILTYDQQTNEAPYGHYGVKKPGQTYFTVNYENIAQNVSLNMPYEILVKPFDYGTGQKDNPYIIYNIDELIKYRDYLKNGFDSTTQYYKIGSVVDGKVIGDPITLDLSEFIDWEPIVNAAGNLDGNNSVIKNINCSTGYKKLDLNGKVEETYFGLFGSTNDTAKINSLTIENVKITTVVNSYNIKAGGFIGLSAGGVFENITVINNKIEINNNFIGTVDVGGLIGYGKIANNSTLTVNQNTVFSEISMLNTDGRAGGIFGNLEGNGNAILNNSASYGKINGFSSLGSATGRVSLNKFDIISFAGLNDLDSSVVNGYIGGLVGTDETNNLATSISDSYYGGKIYAKVLNTTTSIGGLIGSSRIYKDYMSSNQFVFSSESDITTPGINNIPAAFLKTDLTGFTSSDDINNFIASEITKKITNSYYNYNNNRFNTTEAKFIGRFKYYTDITQTETKFTDAIYNINNFEFLLGSKNTDEISKEATFSSEKWNKENGYYPVPKYLVSDNDITATQQNERYIYLLSRFNSLGIFYTNAALKGDTRFSNTFVTADDIILSGESSSSFMRKTNNGKMILSTGEDVTASGNYNTYDVVFSQTMDSFNFSKTIKYTPSTLVTGVPDYSFYYANKEGMWVENETKDGIKINYPWTIFSADQLQGLANLINHEKDGNLLNVLTSELDYNVTAPTGFEKGDNFTLGADVEMYNYYKEDNTTLYGYYLNYKPIGTNTNPFNTTFKGLGHTVSNFNVNANSYDTSSAGLFGFVENGEISDTGIICDVIRVNEQNSVIGIIAGTLLKNSTVKNCFSSGTVINNDNDVASSTVGGIIGKSIGQSNKIINCFNTGSIYITGSNTTVGGIVGFSDNTLIENCYSAGYIEGENSGVIFGSGVSNNIKNCYYDISPVGNLKNTNGAASIFPTASNLGSADFSQVESGLYPVPNCFVGDKLSEKVKSAIIPVYLTNARSATGGSVTYSGASYAIDENHTILPNSVIVKMNETNTAFEKIDSGMVALFLNYKSQRRVVIANLQCWYDAGITNGNNFVINTAKELLEFAHIVNGTLTVINNPNGNHSHNEITNKSFKGWNVSLGSDIDLSVIEDWISIGTNSSPFEGSFNGDGKIIFGIKQSTENIDGNSGLFGTINGAKIENVGITGGNISGATTSGAIVANSINSQITACFNGSDVTAINASGICGNIDANTIVSQSYNMGEIKGTNFAAGISANNIGKIENCYNVGIINNLNSTLGKMAGVSYNNSNGSTVNCYSSAYVYGGEEYYPVVNSNAQNCSFNKTMLTYNGTVSGVIDYIDIIENQYFSASSLTKFSQLKIFAQSTSKLIKDSSELSVIKMDYTGGKYNEFVLAKVQSVIGEGNDELNVELNSTVDAFVFESNGDMWNITPSSQGPSIIKASVNSTIEINHKYYVLAVMTMKIRYRFDFSPLISAGLVQSNTKYNGFENTSTISTWNDNDGATYKISTADDLISFANYVNSGMPTKGKTFILNYSINMANKTIAVIGNNTYPFEGIFDGGCYKISNLTMRNNGVSSLFGTIASSGKIQNLTLESARVIADKANSDMYIAFIAAENNGTIINVGINNGILTANNVSSNQTTYLGSFAAKNSGKIRGCYFIQDRNTPYGINHSSKQTDFAGGMVGENVGSITGCYYVSNIHSNIIKAIAGSNNGKSGNIINCYFNAKGEDRPTNISFAYDQVPWDDYYVSESNMKNKEFAKWLSSNIYGGTFAQGTRGEFTGTADSTILNDSLPYLTCNELIKYDLMSHFNQSNTMMLSVWNMEDEQNFSLSNGIFALDDLEYKFFKNVITHKSLKFDMSLLPEDVGYDITSRVYGRSAIYNKDVSSGILSQESKNVINIGKTADTEMYIVDIETDVGTDKITTPNLIVVDIKFKKITPANMWGVYRPWSAT